jgi:hypothetical protein
MHPVERWMVDVRWLFADRDADFDYGDPGETELFEPE